MLLDGNISGKRFKEIQLEHMEDLFPNHTYDEKRSIVHLRNDILAEEDENMPKSENINLPHISKDDPSVLRGNFS